MNNFLVCVALLCAGLFTTTHAGTGWGQPITEDDVCEYVGGECGNPRTSSCANGLFFGPGSYCVKAGRQCCIPSKPSPSRIIQNISPRCLDGLNKQANAELGAFYIYLSMAFYFQRHDVALSGFEEHFHKRALAELSHAELLMKYINNRGGNVVMKAIAKPQKDDWGSPLEILMYSLELEKKVNLMLIGLQNLCASDGDLQTGYLLRSTLLTVQVEDIKFLSYTMTELVAQGLWFVNSRIGAMDAM